MATNEYAVADVGQAGGSTGNEGPSVSCIGGGGGGGGGGSALPPAVFVRNLFRSYGSKSTATPVLRDVNVCVPKGIIYGLLGPSGYISIIILSI